jgi:hypothetical protein
LPQLHDTPESIMIALLLVLSCCRNADLLLAENGRAQFVLAVASASTPAETTAANELAEFLHRATGATWRIVKETDLQQGRAIYLGQTQFAARRGIKFASLGPEEWVLRAAGGSLVICGGRPRGTLYGVYDFLERFAGVRFLDADLEVVPRATALAVPVNLAIRTAPAFFRREIFMISSRDPKHIRFQVRRRINSFGVGTRSPGPEWGFSVRYGSPYSNHGQARYSKQLPDKPELFALTASGKRLHPGGQPCMSHPEVRRFFVERMLQYIRDDRAQIAKAGVGEPYPIAYDVSPADDGSAKCLCERCTATARRYGAYSGVVIDFTNAIAAEVAKHYPDVLVQTAAYEYYISPPPGLRPRDNVLVRIAQLGAEFHVLPNRDTLRGLDHPLNAEALKIHQAWPQTCAVLGVHDYWTPWSQPFQWPHANIHGLARTLRLYHDCAVKDFFVEDELFGTRIHNFVDLQYYLASTLLIDPQQDTERLIDDFVRPYYGPAAPQMRRLLEYIERRQEEQPDCLATVPPQARRYFDAAFFRDTDALLTQAESSVAGDAQRLARVRQERLAIDETLLYLGSRLSKQHRLPLERTAVLERLAQSYAAAWRKYGGWGEAAKQGDAARLDYLRNMPPLPAELADKKLIDVCGPQLQLGAEAIARYVDDPDAACGKAWRLDATLAGSAGHHALPPQFGLYDNQSKLRLKQVLAADRVPHDEQYHLHLVGRIQATTSMYFWAHASWRLSQRLHMAYDASLPEQKTYDVYASVKLEGPAYVPGSTRANAFSIDRLILVEVAPQKADP